MAFTLNSYQDTQESKLPLTPYGPAELPNAPESFETTVKWGGMVNRVHSLQREACGFGYFCHLQAV